MATSDFQTTWIPRIGEEVTAELRRYRYVVGVGPLTMCVLAGGASLAFGEGVLYDVLAVVLVAATVGIFVALVNSQRRLAAALSRWFGVKIASGQLPIMNRKRFDSWCEKRGLRSPGGRADRPIGKVPLESMTLMRWDFPAPPGLWPGEQMLWSGIGYTSQPKGWLEGTIYVTSGRVMFVPARISPFPINGPEVQRFQLSDFLSVKLEDQGPAPALLGC